jgi:oligopeptide transport system substrate-binding protein
VGLSRRRVLALAAAGIGASPALAASPLRLAVPATPDVLDPQLAVTPIDRAFAGELFPGLLACDANGALVPALAESWTESADGLGYTFTLRADVRWSDGSPLTIQDAKFALDRALDPATAAPFAGTLAPLTGSKGAGVAIVDRRTLRLTIAGRDARFLHALTQPVAAPVPRAAVARHGSAWAAPERIVCSGSYVPVRDAEGFALARNPAAALPPLVELLHCAPVPSLEAAAERIRRGEADLAWGFAPEPIADRALARTLKAHPGEALLFVAINTRRPKLDNRELRHALGMTIERERLVRALRLADAPLGAAPAYAAVPPGARSWPVPRAAPYQRIDAADRGIIAQVLLLEEGVDPAHPAELRLGFAAGRVTAAIARSLAESWGKLGFRIVLEERATAALAREVADGSHDLALMASPAVAAGPWPYLSFLATTAGAENPARYAEPEFDQHLADAAAASDAAAAAQHLGDAEGVLAEDQVILPILTFHPLHAAGTSVAGWESGAMPPLRQLARR